MSSEAKTGQCLCGAVRFTATDVDPHMHSCHCGMCRRWSGGPALSARVGSISFEGEDRIGTYASSAWAERAFCTQCGTNLYYRMPQQDMIIVWMGVFDDLSSFELAGEIYVDDKPDFYALAGEHPRQTGAEFLASIGMPTGD